MFHGLGYISDLGADPFDANKPASGRVPREESIAACDEIVWRARSLAAQLNRVVKALAENAKQQAETGTKASVPGQRERYLNALERMANREGNLKEKKAKIESSLAALKGRFDRIVEQVRGFPGMSGMPGLGDLGRHRHHGGGGGRHGGGGWRGWGGSNFFPYPAYYGPDILLISESGGEDETKDEEDENDLREGKRTRRKKFGWVPAVPPSATSALLGLLGCCD
jgi:hypothetical protein